MCKKHPSGYKHKCFRNWNESSSQMETNIILEGFLEAEPVHGVRYAKFIGDGDSSVHSPLLQNVPGWDHAIKKLECANHACKCYRGALERLVQDCSGGLTQRMRKRLVTAARNKTFTPLLWFSSALAVNIFAQQLRSKPHHPLLPCLHRPPHPRTP